MRYSLMFVIIALSTSSISYAQATEETIRSLHDAYCNAVEKKDSSFLKMIFHEKMVVTSSSGTRRDKREEIKDALDPNYTVNFFRARKVDIRAFESTAVVTGELYWEMVFDGKTSTNERAFTFTYAKIDGNWKVVAQHMGRVSPK